MAKNETLLKLINFFNSTYKISEILLDSYKRNIYSVKKWQTKLVIRKSNNFENVLFLNLNSKFILIE